MRDRSRSAAVLVPLVALLAGCGGSSGDAAAPRSPTTEPTAGTSAAATSAAPTTGSQATPSPGTAGGTASAKPAGGGTPAASPAAQPRTFVLDAKLSTTCVKPGGSMTLTVHARPQMALVFDTRYADDKDGQVHGGIDSGGQTDVHGDYTKTWTVDPLTPTGDADTQVAAVDQQGSGSRKLPFRVAASCS